MACYKVGIIGYGGFGRFLHHAWKSLDTVTIAAVADRDERQSPEQITFYEDWRQLIADPEVDIVSVVTPPASHAEIACAAMESGKHVLIEKPLAVSMADAKRIIDSRDRTGMVAAIDFMQRFNPIVEALQQLNQQRIFGKLRRVDVENYAQDSSLPADHWFWDPAVGGGILIEHAVHFIDIVHYISNVSVRNVDGFCASTDGNRENEVIANVLYDDGLIATHYHSFTRPGFFEDTSIRLSYDLAQIDLHGWIPLNGEFRILVNAFTEIALDRLPGLNVKHTRRIDEIDDISRPEGWGNNLSADNESAGKIQSGSILYNRDKMLSGTFEINATKSAVYQESVRKIMSDLVQTIEDPHHRLRASLEDGRRSLDIAIRATKDTILKVKRKNTFFDQTSSLKKFQEYYN